MSAPTPDASDEMRLRAADAIADGLLNLLFYDDHQRAVEGRNLLAAGIADALAYLRGEADRG